MLSEGFHSSISPLFRKYTNTIFYDAVLVEVQLNLSAVQMEMLPMGYI